MPLQAQGKHDTPIAPVVNDCSARGLLVWERGEQGMGPGGVQAGRASAPSSKAGLPTRQAEPEGE